MTKILPVDHFRNLNGSFRNYRPIEFGMFRMTGMDESEGGLLSAAETCNWLVERIRELVRTKWFKRGRDGRTCREKLSRKRPSNTWSG